MLKKIIISLLIIANVIYGFYSLIFGVFTGLDFFDLSSLLFFTGNIYFLYNSFDE